MSHPTIPPDELRDAAILAHVCLLVDSARIYGLVTGGPPVNTERCEDVLAQAQEHGITFTKAEVDEAVGEFLADYNAGAK